MDEFQRRFKKIYVEISNICNLSCDFCPEVLRPKKQMAPKDFASIAPSLAKMTDQVCLHVMGEPLAHPEFSSFIDICERNNLSVNLTTNGTLINQNIFGLLTNPIIKQINFSVHSFEGNFPGKNISNYINKLIQFIDHAFVVRPDLYINFRLWNDGHDSNIANIPIFNILKEHFGEFRTTVDVAWKKGVKVKNRFYLHFDSRFEWPTESMPFRTEMGHCYGLSSHFAILTEGTVIPCCLDKEAVINLGNCFETPLAEILQTPRAEKMLGGFKKGHLVEELCQKCTYIARFDKKTPGLKKLSVRSGLPT